jgi:hypothetical protein
MNVLAAEVLSVSGKSWKITLSVVFSEEAFLAVVYDY